MREWKVNKKIGGDFVIKTSGNVAPITVGNEKLAARIAKLLNRAEREKEKEKKLDKPSDEFIRAFCDTGSVAVDCEYCGRFHFTSEEEHAGEYSEKDWQELLDRAEKNPDKYVYHGGWGGEYISWGYLDGKQIVADCPCHGARRYEDWIWGHRYMISEYFKTMAKKWIENAKRVCDLANIDTTMLEKEDLKIEGRVRRPSQ